MARIIVYKNTTYTFDVQGTILIILSSLFLFLFSLLLLKTNLEISVVIVLVLIYSIIIFHLKRIKDSIFYFFPIEVYTIDKDKLYYEKKLELFSKFVILRKIIIPIFEIEKITDLGARKIGNAKGAFSNPFWYLVYFKPNQRIKIELRNGESYKVWNFVKHSSYNDYFSDNKETEIEFKEMFENLKKFIEYGKRNCEYDELKRESQITYDLSKKSDT